MNILLVSYHNLFSKNRAGFHFLAEAYAKSGHSVDFITCSISLLSIIKKDIRLTNVKKKFKFNNWVFSEDLKIRVLMPLSLFHPINLRVKILENFLWRIFYWHYILVFKRLNLSLSCYDIIIVESASGLIWLNYFFEKNGFSNNKTKIIYRVSDDLNFLKISKAVKYAEFKLSDKFTLISCPTHVICKKFIRNDNVKLHPHGISTDVFDNCKKNPFPVASIKNVVYVGMSHFDYDNFYLIARNRPDVDFHIFGNVEIRKKMNNIFYYGVVDFNETVPYIKYADLALQMRCVGDDVSLRHSLKIQQYYYCKVPVFGPYQLNTDWGNYISYDPNSTSDQILSEFNKAINHTYNKNDDIFILSWEKISNMLISDAQNK